MAMKPKGLVALATLVLVAIGISAGTLLAADPQPQPAKPTAVIEIVPVAANPADPNVIEATLADGKTKVRMGATGLPNVSVGVPVTLQGSATDPKLALTKYAWTLTAPGASNATLAPDNEPIVKFTPDVSGIYKVDLVLSNEAGASPMASVQIHAGEYVGVAAGNCAQCHPQKAEEWSETPHGTKLQREINGSADPASSHYNEGCVRCHSVGYYPGVQNGGFAAVQEATSWTFPEASDINAGKDNWSAMPQSLQNLGNIQCENCHGPAKDHVADSSVKPGVSMSEGVCNVCHDGGGSHIRGAALRNAKHADAASTAWNYPTGPDHQDCVRCHSGAGFVSFLENPTEKASWDNSKQTVVCATCHDPHSDANKFQLRITGKPVEAVGVTKDFGLSAVCVECHNARVPASEAEKGQRPHYSAGAEMLSDSGGVTYGQEVPNSAHGMLVGSFPVKNGDKTLFGGANAGPCVVCHMWPTVDAKDPNYLKVGDHSFNTVSPDGKFQYTAACQTCHQGAQGLSDFKAKADYDGSGQAETVQAEVAGLLKLLRKAIADSGIKPVEGHPYFDRADLAKANEKQNNAVYNYLFVRGLEGSDGKANAIHNFKRSVALLQLSYRDLTGSDVPKGTLIK